MALCGVLYMATNIELNETLLKKAMTLGGLRTKKDTVNEALAEYVQRREQLKIVELFGTIEYEKSFDYKKQRSIK